MEIRSSINLAVLAAMRFLSSMIVSLYTFTKAARIASARDMLVSEQVICTNVVRSPAKEVAILDW